MLAVSILESTKKNNPQLSLGFKSKDIVKINVILEGADIDNQIELLKKSNVELFNQTKRAIIYNKGSAWNYIHQFSSLESLHISGSAILEFPNLNNLKNLRQIYIDSFSKPMRLVNLSTAKNLKELSIGTWTFNGPVILDSFDEIMKCNKLERLVLSYSIFEETELKKIINLKSLKELVIHQKIETSTLAYLAAKLPNIKSKELTPWQDVPNSDNKIKINGKRKPYLDKEKDKLKIHKYEEEFENLKALYA